MAYSNARTIEPQTEPVTIEQLDAHLRGDGLLASSEPDFLSDLITAARNYVEEYTRRALISQEWTLTLNNWPTIDSDMGWWDGVRQGSILAQNTDFIRLPIAPLRSVTEIRTYNMDDTSAVFPEANYHLDVNATPGEIYLKDGHIWPVFTRRRSGIVIKYVAGYGELLTDVPGALRMVIRQLAGHWYENREFVNPQSGLIISRAGTPLHIQSVLNRYRIKRL